MEKLKILLKTDKFNEEKKCFEGDEYRINNERVSKRRKDDPRYFENILRLTDETHVHIFFESDEGKELLIRIVKLCFPIAEIEIADIDESELEAKRERWRISGKYL
jgi:hypothetical protein